MGRLGLYGPGTGVRSSLARHTESRRRQAIRLRNDTLQRAVISSRILQYAGFARWVLESSERVGLTRSHLGSGSRVGAPRGMPAGDVFPVSRPVRAEST